MSAPADANYQHFSHARRKARHFGMQALYGWDMSGSAARDIIAQFRLDNDMKGADIDYFEAMVTGVIAGSSLLDGIYGTFMQERSVAELDKVELALLRVATWEMHARLDTPFKVVINEAVALARKFGATDSYKYINGVLDQVARVLRSAEVSAAGDKS